MELLGRVVESLIKKISIHPPWRELEMPEGRGGGEFPFFEHKNNPEFLQVSCTPPILSGKIVLARKYVKVKVNTPNT